jgi:hypothetical protein
VIRAFIGGLLGIIIVLGPAGLVWLGQSGHVVAGYGLAFVWATCMLGAHFLGDS